MADIFNYFLELLREAIFEPINVQKYGYNYGKIAIERSILNCISSSILLVIILMLIKRWYEHRELRRLLKPGILIEIGWLLFAFFGIANPLVMYLTDYTFGLDAVIIQAAPLLLILFYSLPLFVSFVRVPTSRQNRLKLLLTVNKLVLLLFIVIVTVNFFLVSGLLGLVVSAFIAVFIMIVTVPVIANLYRESKDNASKLTKIRLEMQLLSWFGFISIIIMGPSLAVIELLFFPAGVPKDFMFFTEILWVMAQIMGGVGTYWTFFPPNWMRNRHGVFYPGALQRKKATNSLTKNPWK
ncbi:MAG: hypothetical protein ACFFD4_14010 [Candidatus Odinarchaeota archaeon]